MSLDIGPSKEFVKKFDSSDRDNKSDKKKKGKKKSMFGKKDKESEGKSKFAKFLKKD